MKWEYRIERVNKNSESREFDIANLNKVGKQEWEAVGIIDDPNYSDCYVLLKRQVK